MIGRRCLGVLAAIVVATAGCSVEFPVPVPVCRDASTEVRVNQRGDQDEFTNHPHAAAAIANGRVVVAFVAQPVGQTFTDPNATSEVRIAMVDEATGERINLCNTTNLDSTISNEGAFAFAASVAPVDLTIAGTQAVALVSWTEGTAFPNVFVEMKFIDGAGCPLTPAFRPYDGPAMASSLVWSAQQHAVLATLEDSQNIYRAWVNSLGPADTVTVAAASSAIASLAVGAVATDGSAAVVWQERLGGLRGALLDPAGNPHAGAGTGPDGTFPIGLPLIAPAADVEYSPSVAAADRIIVAVEARAADHVVPSRAMARAYALDGTALGPAYLLDPDDPQDQSAPSVQIGPGGSLVGIWAARSARGAVGRVFDALGAPRFNSISCDDGTFPIGARVDRILGIPSLVISNGDVLVAHNAEGDGDPIGSAAFLWKAHFADLWPGPQ